MIAHKLCEDGKIAKECTCPNAGYCKQHAMYKTEEMRQLCLTDNCARVVWESRYEKSSSKLHLVKGTEEYNKVTRYTIGPGTAIKVTRYTIGPGTAIKAELAKWGIHPKEKKCKCNDIAAAMDELGPDELERNLDLYVAKMRESFKEWRGGIPIPTPPDFILRQIIEYGISTSRDSLINY